MEKEDIKIELNKLRADLQKVHDRLNFLLDICAPRNEVEAEIFNYGYIKEFVNKLEKCLEE